MLSATLVGVMALFNKSIIIGLLFGTAIYLMAWLCNNDKSKSELRTEYVIGVGFITITIYAIALLLMTGVAWLAATFLTIIAVPRLQLNVEVITILYSLPAYWIIGLHLYRALKKLPREARKL